MDNSPAQTLSRWNIWWLAIRPKTLPASMAGVVAGCALAIKDDHFSFFPALAALLVGLFLQIASNLANDVFDFERGTDNPDRLGPTRVTQAGLLTPREVKTGLGIVVGMAIVAGLYLYTVAGWPVLLIGSAAILSAILYTGGPYPLGYHGFGDLFVFLFFGLAAVTGTYFVQSGTVSASAWMLSMPIGFIVVDLLVVNNLRDIDTDKRSGKNSLAVRIGKKNTRWEYITLLVLAYLFLPLLALGKLIPYWGLLPWLSIPFAWSITKIVLNKEGRALNPALAGTSQLALVYAVLFLVGIILDRII